MIRIRDGRNTSDTIWNPPVDEYELELRHMLAEKPSDALLWYRLGLHLEASDRFQEAEDALLKSLRISPRTESTLWELAVLYERMGRFDLADEIWQKLRRTKSKDFISIVEVQEWLELRSRW